MKSWFPFTDYDFYAYLASGALLIAAADMAFNGSAALSRADWSFVAITVFIAAAYVAGHLVAALSSPILEHWFARTVLTAPGIVQLNLRPRNAFERFIGAAIGRYYEPFPAATLAKINAGAHADLGQPTGSLSFEDIFQAAHRRAYAADHVRERVEQFRNQYGFCRNIAFVSLLAVAFFALQAFSPESAGAWRWIAIAIVAAVGMTLRFLKFYAAFAAEVLRTLTK